MNPVAVFVFGYLPYIVVLIFIIGVLYRIATWVSARELTGLFNVNVCWYKTSTPFTVGEVLKRIFLFYTLPGTGKDNALFIGSFIFHWSIWIALIGHMGIMIPPEYLKQWFGITTELHHLIAMYVGGTAGTLSVIGILILLARRIAGRTVTLRLVNEYKIPVPLRRLSLLDDWFALLIILAIQILGLVQTLGITPANPYYVEEISKWMWSLITFRPDVTPILDKPVLMAHAILAMIFIAYIPFGKMIHPFSFLFMPTIARSAIKVKVPAEVPWGRR